MSRAPSLTLAELAALPSPTAAQLDAFAAHVPGAHSWYKHLPLLAGGEFVVFMAPDAGAGFEQRERMHYSWKRTAEYRARFGFLDYAWRLEGERHFARDAVTDAPPLELLGPARVARLRLRSYPMLSTDFNAIEAIHYDLHAEDLADLRAGAPHPQRADILAWAELEAASNASYELLDEASMQLRDQLAERRDRSARDEGIELRVDELARLADVALDHPAIVDLHIEEQLDELYAQMQSREQAKLRAALAQLVEVYDELRAELAR